MKKLMIILMILFIAGCSVAVEDATTEEKPVPEPTTQVQEKVVEEPVKEPVVEEKVSEPVVEPEPTVIVNSGEEKELASESEIPPAPTSTKPKVFSGELDEDVKELLSKADEKITSYQFTYAGPPDNLARDVWNIKGTRIKVELFDENWISHDEYYDTVYIDTVKKTAVGYCQNPRTARCADKDKEFDVNYEGIMIKTPYQWVKSLQTPVEILGTEMLYDRKVTVLRYMDGEKEYKQWVDSFAGLTTRVQIKEPGKDPVKWEYRYLAINSVRDSDLEMKQVYQEN